VPGVPDSTLETALDAVGNDDFSSWYGKSCKYTFANSDFEIAVCGANEQPDGVIKGITKISGGKYDIEVYTTKFTGTHEIGLTGLALGDYVEAGAAGIWASDATNGTYRVIGYNTPSAIVVKSRGNAVTALAGTLTGTVDGTLADVAAIALSTAGGNTYSDSAVNTAVNAAITSLNLQLKEIQTVLNAVIVQLNKNA